MSDSKIKVHDLFFKPYITSDQLNDTVKRLANELKPLYAGKDLLVIGVLNGAVFFTVDLLRELNLPYRLDFIQASSYSGIQSSGHVHVTELKERITDAHVLLIEDIVDTGRTIQVIKAVIQDSDPASVRLASLFYKPEADLYKTPPDFIGFTIPNDFILGYGLDYDGLGRDLKDVYVVADD